MHNKIFYLIFFGIILALARLIPHPPNFSLIIASAIMAPILIKSRFFAISITLVAMFFTDIIVGFHPYMLVIYLTIASISLLSPIKRKLKNFMIFSIFASLWFFIITNFAVWLAWDYYPKSIEGLISCYVLAIPFFINTLISSILFTTILFYLYRPLEILNYKFQNSLSLLFKKFI